MELVGQDLRAQTGQDRCEALRHLLAIGDTERGIQLSEHVDVVDGATLFQHACAIGLERIVDERRDRAYRSGRSMDWIKIKNPSAPAARRVIEG